MVYVSKPACLSSKGETVTLSRATLMDVVFRFLEIWNEILQSEFRNKPEE